MLPLLRYFILADAREQDNGFFRRKQLPTAQRSFRRHRQLPGDSLSKMIPTFTLLAVLCGTMCLLPTTLASSPNGVYFSISKLRMTLPISKESYIILRNEPIVQLQLLSSGSELRTNAIDQQHGYSYAIESPPDTKYLKVDSSTGALWITSQIYTMSNVTEFVIVAVNSSVSSPFAHGVMPAARLTLTIDPVLVAEDTLDSFCEHHPERACFWDTAQYRVAENGPLGWTIGAVGPTFYRRLCPQHLPKYEIFVATPGNMNGSNEYLLLDPNDGTLRTKVSFDHDTHAPGPTLQARVRCTLQQFSTDVDVKSIKSESQTVDRTITVNVLDRNDNLPRLEQLNRTDSSNHHEEQDDVSSYQVYVDDPHVNQGDTVGYFRIMFTDDDSIPVNTRVHYKLHGDVMELFHPDCAMYENEHNGGLKQTVFGCKLIFARSGILRKSPYCVTLQAVDQTVELSPYDTVQPAALFANASICLTTNLNRIHEYDMPRPEALTSSGIVHATSYGEGSGFRGEQKPGRKKSKKEANPAKIVYPKEAIVYDTSRKYARIAEPKSFKQLIQENSADQNFRLTSNPLNAFGITKIAGIIYLKNETAFQNKPESRHEITVAWKNYTVSVLVRLRKNPNVHCSPAPIEHAAEDFCAAHPNRTSCESACGLGSLMGPCEYRAPGTSVFDEPKPVAWTEDYPTCSSGLSHCPDGICDPLEEMGHREKIHICPQDCVFKQDIFGVHHSDKPRGIQTASGHCSCRASGHCSCIDTLRIPSSYKRNKTITTTSSSTSTTTTTPANIAGVSGSDVELVPIFGKNHSEGKLIGGGTRRDPSDRTGDAPPAAVRDGNFYESGFIKGPHASIYLIAIVLIPMIVAVMIVLYCFSRKLTVKNKLLNGSGGNGTSGGMNSISMNLVSNDTEIFNVELPLTSRLNEFNFKIDVIRLQVEFPRSSLMLDATLGEGEFGKVLKGFATDLPEKPGITTVAVKMLKTGANSVELLLLSEYQLLQEVNHPNVIRLLGACTKGDTPLLIIEYCQYGSLKNYLRLSRKLEVLNADYENAVEPITVKDILSFAWQISKGMAYLTDIKLVHRDLAARNVLLAEGKVCKSQTGLTRDVYEMMRTKEKQGSSTGQVDGTRIASRSHLHHQKRCVGIWCTVLGANNARASPYPGIPPQNLTLLKQGYRMECPKNCSEEIWNNLLGRSAKYIDMERILFPIRCTVLTSMKSTAQLTICKEEQDRLESLWTPPQYETMDTMSAEHTGRYQTPSAMAVTAVIAELTEDKKQLLLQSYDTPRPLIETTTIEQKLRYENDVRLRPKKLSNASGSSSSSNEEESHHHHVHRSCGGAVRSSSISPPRCLRNHFEETSFITSTPIQGDRDTASSSSFSNGNSEYDSPSRQPRVVSYVDMNKNNRHLNANLEINNMIDKKQSKDIALRFSNVDNELQMILVDPISGLTSIQSCPKSVSIESQLAISNEVLLEEHKITNNSNAEVPVEYAAVMKKHATNGKEPVGLTLTSTV
uniref:Protein kinase domain-containing protein n=1 Tax=Anopheles funestus TaxID=62324 RepID=A0A4Y0BQ49_ANOFN